MAGKAVDAGRDFVGELLKRSKLSAEQQAAILEDDTVLEFAGESTLMRAESTRLADAVRAEQVRLKDIADKQTTWWKSNERTALEATIEELKTKGGTHNPGGIDEKALDTRLSELTNGMEAMGVALGATMTNIGLSHLKEFGETIDMDKLAKDAIAGKKTLVQHYAEIVAPERKKRADAAVTKQVEDAKAAGILEGRMQALNQKGPYPVGPGGPSTLDGLRKSDKQVADDHTLAAAVATVEAELAKV